MGGNAFYFPLLGPNHLQNLTPKRKILTLFGPDKIFGLMAQEGIDSTQHIQTLITPDLQKIKNLFLLHEKLNFLTKNLKMGGGALGSATYVIEVITTPRNQSSAQEQVPQQNPSCKHNWLVKTFFILVLTNYGIITEQRLVSSLGIDWIIMLLKGEKRSFNLRPLKYSATVLSI